MHRCDACLPPTSINGLALAGAPVRRGLPKAAAALALALARTSVAEPTGYDLYPAASAAQFIIILEPTSTPTSPPFAVASKRLVPR